LYKKSDRSIFFVKTFAFLGVMRSQWRGVGPQFVGGGDTGGYTGGFPRNGDAPPPSRFDIVREL